MCVCVLHFRVFHVFFDFLFLSVCLLVLFTPMMLQQVSFALKDSSLVYTMEGLQRKGEHLFKKACLAWFGCFSHVWQLSMVEWVCFVFSSDGFGGWFCDQVDPLRTCVPSNKTACQDWCPIVWQGSPWDNYIWKTKLAWKTMFPSQRSGSHKLNSERPPRHVEHHQSQWPRSQASQHGTTSITRTHCERTQ